MGEERAGPERVGVGEEGEPLEPRGVWGLNLFLVEKSAGI